MPITVSFVLLNGGFFNNIFKLISVSGILFLGVGDTLVRNFNINSYTKGFNYGKIVW